MGFLSGFLSKQCSLLDHAPCRRILPWWTMPFDSAHCRRVQRITSSAGLCLLSAPWEQRRMLSRQQASSSLCTQIPKFMKGEYLSADARLELCRSWRKRNTLEGVMRAMRMMSQLQFESGLDDAAQMRDLVARIPTASTSQSLGSCYATSTAGRVVQLQGL